MQGQCNTTSLLHPDPRLAKSQGSRELEQRNSSGLQGTGAAGLTLTELLVVIAFLGILSAILFLGIGSAIEMANKTTSASNMRQIGVGLNLYALEEPENRLPPFWENRFTTSGILNNAFVRLVEGGYVSDTRVFIAPNDSHRLPTVDESGWAQNPEQGQFENQYSSYHYLYVEPGTRDQSPGGPSSIESVLKPRYQLFNDPDVIVVFEQTAYGPFSAYNKDGGIHVLRLGGSVEYIRKDEFPSPNFNTRMFSHFESNP